MYVGIFRLTAAARTHMMWFWLLFFPEPWSFTGRSVMNKAIKYRLYPTTEQETMFAKTFGCYRKVWNLMLSDKMEGYQAAGKCRQMVFIKPDM